VIGGGKNTYLPFIVHNKILQTDGLTYTNENEDAIGSVVLTKDYEMLLVTILQYITRL